MTQIESLAARQLAAYNAADLDAFCDCYHPEVRVLDDLEERLAGIAAFRERYRDLFTRWTFGAEVTQRLVLGPHAIDLERWWRIDPDQGKRSEGEVLVRYSLRDDRIGTVQFLRP
ncbi:MAG: nuclear transport factor 2 family protein [Phycisphaerales bacterium]